MTPDAPRTERWEMIAVDGGYVIGEVDSGKRLTATPISEREALRLTAAYNLAAWRATPADSLDALTGFIPGMNVGTGGNVLTPADFGVHVSLPADSLDAPTLARAILVARSTTADWKGSARATEPTRWDMLMAKRAAAVYNRLQAGQRYPRNDEPEPAG